MQRRTLALALVTALALGTLGACSSGESEGAKTTTTKASADAPTTTIAAAEPLQILVSNDDSYEAPGIDALVEGLRTLEGVEVTVVAPLDERSGSGGKTTDGELDVTDVETLSGYPATAVDGYPADSVRVAFEDLGLEPDLVITGINSIQNIGTTIDNSGTVGAAREGVARGVPALATSHGRIADGNATDYAAAVPFVLDWVEEHRDAIAAGTEEVQVTNLNVPSCPDGEVRGLLTVPADTEGDLASALVVQDCTSTTPEAELSTDVAAFVEGFATIGVIPSTPGG